MAEDIGCIFEWIYRPLIDGRMKGQPDHFCCFGLGFRVIRPRLDSVHIVLG
jgi:hypothetical protein